MAAGTNPPVISGYDCGGLSEPCIHPFDLRYFRPEVSNTRAQFAKMLTLARQWPQVTPSAPNISSVCDHYNSFEDVCSDAWSYALIETVKAHNGIDGYTCGGTGEPCNSRNDPYFRPGGTFTRGQMTKIIDRSLTYDIGTLQPVLGWCTP